MNHRGQNVTVTLHFAKWRSVNYLGKRDHHLQHESWSITYRMNLVICLSFYLDIIYCVIAFTKEDRYIYASLTCGGSSSSFSPEFCQI